MDRSAVHRKRSRASRRVWLGVVCLASTWLLAACGGGGGGSEAAPEVAPIATATSNHFPLDSNTRLVYITSAGSEPVVTSVTGTQLVGGQSGTLLSTVDPSGNSEDTVVYVATASGVREYAPAGADALARAFDGTEIMRWPARAGDSYVQADSTFDAGEDFDGDGRSDRITLRAVLTVVGSETVVTPAGTFTNSLHQRQNVKLTYLPTLAGATPVVVDAVVDTWYAPNIGPVKTVVVTRGPGTETTLTETLSAYRVGTRSSDTVAPTVQSVAPGAQPTRGATTAVSAAFSEAMDAGSFTPGSFTVLNSEGRAIAGTVRVQGQAITFEAAQAWASGSYTARISTAARDLMGNALAADRQWAFSVDATAPGVVSSTPGADANNVALDAAIVLQFSEAPNPASINAGNIDLRNGGITTPALLSVEGQRVTITPTGGLQPGKLYELVVTNVTDALGNPMAEAWRLPFRTTQGRFAYPEALFSGASVQSVAVGDVNGDGRPDVLAYTQSNMVVPTSALQLRAGQPDGSLAEPVTIEQAGLANCNVSAIAIGDLTGDGRPDVVLGGDGCGLQVLQQTAAGTLVAGQLIVIGRFNLGRLRLADVDGDGRLDLLLSFTGANSGVVEVWSRDASGQLALVRTVTGFARYAGQMEVADLNGDGRADLVVQVDNGPRTEIAVLLQRTDGSFDSPSFLGTGSMWGASSVAVGDLNGDGRPDIVASTGGNSPTFIAVFYQGTGGSFGTATQVSTYDIPSAVRVADIDGDGRADVVVMHRAWSAVGLYLQQPGGTLAAEVRFAAPYGSLSPETLLVADVNGDGRPDVLVDGELIRQLPQAGTATPSRWRPAPLRRATSSSAPMFR
jgi:hypothetical protein